MTARDIELAVALHFGVRQNIIVPNVSWGMFRDHEADMIVLRSSGWADEIEIKVTAADIRADLKKNRGRGHARPSTVRCLWFAVPEHLSRHSDIPAVVGILSVSDDRKVSLVRPPFVNPAARKLTDKETRQLMRLGCMRIWALKKHLSINRKRGVK